MGAGKTTLSRILAAAGVTSLSGKPPLDALAEMKLERAAAKGRALGDWTTYTLLMRGHIDAFVLRSQPAVAFVHRVEFLRFGESTFGASLLRTSREEHLHRVGVRERGSPGAAKSVSWAAANWDAVELNLESGWPPLYVLNAASDPWELALELAAGSRLTQPLTKGVPGSRDAGD
jgi:hypothetical protein